MRNHRKPRDTISFNPPTSINDNGRLIHIIFALPGITEEQVRIDLEKTDFILSIVDDDRILRKTIQIPEGARLFKKKFSFGVLEIFLEKPSP